ncbi:MAG: hypothetical protein KIT60_01925 [Burkholderiaceae bacterium]|nr:hypothetical protein [Burkholderiaceae bacterium]
MIEKLRMWSIELPVLRAAAADKTAKPFQRKLTSRSDVKGRRPVLELKKRHVQEKTRLPTKRMATACWAFIVAKSTSRKSAPMLVFRSLQGANSKQDSTAYQQARHSPPAVAVPGRLARGVGLQEANSQPF